MKTEELVTKLSRDDPRPRAFDPSATVAVAAILALAVVLAMSMAWLRPRADLMAALAAENHVFLLKLAFTVGVVLAALPILRDLSLPGRRVRWEGAVAAVPFAIIFGLALGELAVTPFREWSQHIEHASWLECLWQIPALALPAFVILAIAVRRLAPTNLVRAGAYVGLLSGGIGALGYALHCHDDIIAFVAFSYSSAIFGMALIGALLGPRVLRWA